MKMSSNTSVKAIVIAIIALLVGVVVGYATGGMGKVSVDQYQTVSAELENLKTYIGPLAQNLKIGFVYVGPIGDYGWSHAHELARRYLESKFTWVDTSYVESVAEADCQRVSDQLAAAGNKVIFTTSFGFMDGTVAAAHDNNETMFFHCSGYERAPNLGTYMADFYQLYYLNGLMAGALTKTNKVGYVGAYPIPEVIRHINAFAIGVKETNPNAKVYVTWMTPYTWYDPVKARQAAESLLSQGVDTLAFTEDSPTVVQVAEESTQQGKQVYVFSHYSPMLSYGPNSAVSGQIVHWEKIYEDIVLKIRLGVYNNTNLQNVDYLWNLKEGGVELGCDFGVPINPKFVNELKGVTVNDPVFGIINVYDLVFKRLAQMRDANIGFDPFTGPIKDQNNNIKIPSGQRATIEYLFGADMNWFNDNIIGNPNG